MENILLIDKPSGITSFGVIRELRKKLGIKKIGHAGTLDPLATGLLVLGVGPGTKLLTNLVKLDKTYEAEVLFGVKTTTGDLEGEVIQELEVTPLRQDFGRQAKSELRMDLVHEVLKSLEGEIELSVPRFSAIKIKGRKLYEMARKGKEFEVPKRIMKIYKITFNDLRYENGKAYLSITLDVGSGTYIRSIAEEIGNRLNIPATLSKLRRTRVGDFRIENSVKLDSFLP